MINRVSLDGRTNLVTVNKIYTNKKNNRNYPSSIDMANNSPRNVSFGTIIPKEGMFVKFVDYLSESGKLSDNDLQRIRRMMSELANDGREDRIVDLCWLRGQSVYGKIDNPPTIELSKIIGYIHLKANSAKKVAGKALGEIEATKKLEDFCTHCFRRFEIETNDNEIKRCLGTSEKNSKVVLDNFIEICESPQKLDKLEESTVYNKSQELIRKSKEEKAEKAKV